MATLEVQELNNNSSPPLKKIDKAAKFTLSVLVELLKLQECETEWLSKMIGRHYISS